MDFKRHIDYSLCLRDREGMEKVIKSSRLWGEINKRMLIGIGNEMPIEAATSLQDWLVGGKG